VNCTDSGPCCCAQPMWYVDVSDSKALSCIAGVDHACNLPAQHSSEDAVLLEGKKELHHLSTPPPPCARSDASGLVLFDIFLKMLMKMKAAGKEAMRASAHARSLAAELGMEGLQGGGLGFAGEDRVGKGVLDFTGDGELGKHQHNNLNVFVREVRGMMLSAGWSAATQCLVLNMGERIEHKLAITPIYVLTRQPAVQALHLGLLQSSSLHCTRSVMGSATNLGLPRKTNPNTGAGCA